MLEIAAFGKISVGKSAVLNELFSVDVFAVDVRGGSTIKVHRHEVKFAGHQLAIIDTPGICEVNGDRRAADAYRAAESADLVLVVFDHDLTETEYVAVKQLGAAGKPLLVVLNKSDALSAQMRVELTKQITDRLDGSHVVVCAADPIRRYARECGGGRIEEWSAKAPPDVDALRERLATILETESSKLQRLNEVRKSSDQIGRASLKADELIENFALGIG
ncbi:MAG: GTPase, partial [Verrucomicrobiota bacterium]